MDKNKQYRIKNVINLSKQLNPYNLGIIGAIISGILNYLLTIGISCTCAYMTGLAIENRISDDFNKLSMLLFGQIILKAIAYFAEMWLAHDVAFKVLSDFRIKLYNSLEKLAPAYLLEVRLGQLVSTLMSDVELLEWFFAHSFGSIVVAVIVPLILLIFLGFFNLFLPIIMLFFIIMLVIVPAVLRNKADTIGNEVRDDYSNSYSCRNGF